MTIRPDQICWALSNVYLSMYTKRIGIRNETGFEKVQVGKDQEKAQSEKDSHSKNRGGKKTN